MDPDEPLHVHVAGVPLLTTKDGGQTWTADASFIHVDHHAMIWDRRHPERVYLGNDGGTYRSDADGDGGWVKATHEPYTQFYSVAITPQDVSRISGGTQDNGSLRSWGGPAFNEYLGGDGEENQINPLDKENVYACYQYGNCFWSVDGGETMTYFGNKVTGARRNWFTPVVFDPRDPSVMYYGANVLNRSTDGGRTWTAISGNLTGGPGRDPIYTKYVDLSGTLPKAPVNDLVIGPGLTLYVATDQGVFVSPSGGGVWLRQGRGLPLVPVDDIEYDRTNHRLVAGTFGRGVYAVRVA